MRGLLSVGVVAGLLGAQGATPKAIATGWAVALDGIYQCQDRRNGGWKGDVLARRIARTPERSRKETVEVRVSDDVHLIRPVIVAMDGADVAFEEMRMEILRKDMK